MWMRKASRITPLLDVVTNIAEKEGAGLVAICAAIEAEIAELGR